MSRRVERNIIIQFKDGYEIKFEFGKHSNKCLNADLIIISPGININNNSFLKKILGKKIPIISATKSQTGHGLGAAGSNESIYSLLMLENDFVAESVNIETLDEEAEGMPIVRKTTQLKLNRILSNSFGFGGTNACLVFERFNQ